MKLSVFVGTSLDGFIARQNGQYDFLPAGGGEPQGYEVFIASVDTTLIGHNTFDVVLKLPKWPYSDKRVVVLSRSPLDLSRITGRVEQMSGDAAQIAQELAATGAKQIYVDGGIVVQAFLRAGLIHHITITRVPVSPEAVFFIPGDLLKGPAATKPFFKLSLRSCQAWRIVFDAPANRRR
jgi:dihydrofolate reductase